MLVVGKVDGDFRICLDASILNKAIQRQHFMVPTVEQLLGKKGKQNIFVVWTRLRAFIKFQFLNVRRIYALWKLKKDDTDSSDYRLDSSVPKVYLQAMSEFFGDLPEVFIYFDDFLVMGDTKEELETCGEFWYVVMN